MPPLHHQFEVAFVQQLFAFPISYFLFSTLLYTFSLYIKLNIFKCHIHIHISIIMPRNTPIENGEEVPLMIDEEQQSENDDHDGGQFAPDPFANLPVYTTIHRIRHEVINSIDDPYSLEQLRAPRINTAIVRPLVDRIWDEKDVSIIYCLLVNKLQFLREQAFEAHQTINTTRATLCELAALKVLRRFDEDNPKREGLLLLANILVAGFEPFQNAPREIKRVHSYASTWNYQKRGSRIGKSTVLEIAIVSESKLFLSAPACQKVMGAIYCGRVVYTPSSFIDIIPDHYKYKPITLYHPKKAPRLNQYRLSVPRTRNALDICQFMILLILYILTMHHRHGAKFTRYELVFCIYAAGWALDEFASILEHGWQCYTQNLWAFLDFMFILIYTAYLVLRLPSLATGDPQYAIPALDILSAGAPVLIPRLAFNLLSENMLFVSLRAMMTDFAVLTLLAAWCFAGFLLSMMWLGNDDHSPITIGKWMLWVWFGLDGTGIENSVDFHWLLGPILMVTFAFVGNELFLTILVSMLSSTFSKIASNVSAEIQFRRAVLTFEGVKSDAIFAYQPPFNILALCFLLPLKMVVSPRWFHKINVAAVRTINAPLLLLIDFYERRQLWSSKPLFKTKVSFWDFSRFSVHADIQTVFDSEPPQRALDEGSDGEGTPHGENHAGRSISFDRKASTRPADRDKAPTKTPKRKGSSTTMDGLPEHLGEWLQGHDGDGLLGRLAALEDSTRRIEKMVKILGQDLGDDSGDSETASRPPTPEEVTEDPGEEPGEPGDESGQPEGQTIRLKH